MTRKLTSIGAALTLLLGLGVAHADMRSGPLPPPPRIPLGIYAVVPVEKVLAAEFPGGLTAPSQGQQIHLEKAITTYLTGVYTDLLDNPAVAGLTLQVHWDTLNPNPPSDPLPLQYNWDFVDDAFASVTQWNADNADSDDAVHLFRFEAVHLADGMPSSVVPISGSVSAWCFR
jgi:hypothetical protein